MCSCECASRAFLCWSPFIPVFVSVCHHSASLKPPLPALCLAFPRGWEPGAGLSCVTAHQPVLVPCCSAGVSVPQGQGRRGATCSPSRPTHQVLRGSQPGWGAGQVSGDQPASWQEIRGSGWLP